MKMEKIEEIKHEVLLDGKRRGNGRIKEGILNLL